MNVRDPQTPERVWSSSILFVGVLGKYSILQPLARAVQNLQKFILDVTTVINPNEKWQEVEMKGFPQVDTLQPSACADTQILSLWAAHTIKEGGTELIHALETGEWYGSGNIEKVRQYIVCSDIYRRQLASKSICF